MKFTSNAWNKNFSEFQEGKIDLITEISHTKQRDNYISFTQPYFEIALHIYSHKSISNYDETLHSLKGKKFGMLKNIFYKDVIENLNLFEIIEYDTYEEKLNALEKNEIDITFGKILNSSKIINNTNFNKIKILGEVSLDTLKKEDLRLGVKKDNPILFSIINKTFNSISSYELKNIKDKWLSSYPKSVNTTYEGDLHLSREEIKYLEKKKVIKICDDPDLAPIIFLDKHNHMTGIVTDITKLISKKLDNKIRIEHIITKTDEDSIELFKKGYCDIYSVALVDKSNKKLLYTKSYLNYKPVLITRDSEPFIYSVDDIKYKGISKKYKKDSIALLKEKFPGINIIPTKTEKEAFEKVSSGELYATLDLLPVASYHISKYGLSNLKIAGHAKENISFSMALNKRDYVLHSILNKSIDSITEREKSKIYNTWTNIQYDTKINYTKLIYMGSILLLIILFFVYRQISLKKHNTKLEESNAQFQTLFETTVESILITDKKGNIVECNNISSILLGYDKEELLTMNIEDFLLETYGYNEDKTNQNSEYEIQIQNANKTLIPVLMRYSNVIRNKRPHVVFIILNLTKLKKTQEALESLNQELSIKVFNEVEKNKQKDLKLLQQARHAQMGELISMIAHQWRQPLNAIATTIMNIEFQVSFKNFDLDNKKGQEKFIEFINLQMKNIDDLIQTLSTTIDDFRNFYKPDKQFQIRTVNMAIYKTLNILKALINSKNIDLKLNLSSKKEIELFESELLQVFLNILKNSQDNFEDKQIKNPQVLLNSYDTENGVIVEIEDNGGGISPQIINNIFDPYFSTKHVKNGTGLGLYMSKTIIEEHHKGKLTVANKNGGVCFRVELNESIKQE